jgi:hypothetical protein
MDSGAGTGAVDAPATYVIRVQGHLDRQWAGWLDDLVITHVPSGESQLVCRVRDQAALHGLLNQLFALNITLVSVVRQGSLPPETGSERPSR